MRIPTLVLVLCASVSLCVGTRAQAPSFDAVSIKRNASNNLGNSLDMRAGRFSVTNAALLLVFSIAFDVRDYQIVGAPDWFASDRYDIVATMPEGR